MRRRLVPLVGALVLLAGTGPLPAGAAGGTQCPTGAACLLVQTVGLDAAGHPTADQRAFSVADLGDTLPYDQPRPEDYSLRSASGSSSFTVPAAVTINAIVSAVEPSSSASFVTVSIGDTGTSDVSELTGADLAGSDFQSAGDGSPIRPVFWASGLDQLAYLRPQRSPADVNAPVLQTSCTSYRPTKPPTCAVDEALDVVVHTAGQLLDPTIIASDTTIRAGGSTVLTARLPSAPPPGVRYTWYFDDGAGQPPVTTHRPSIRHSYPTPGVPAPLVVVTAKDTSFGKSTPVILHVGKAHAGAGDGGGGRGGRQNPTTGPARSGGTEAGGAAGRRRPSSPSGRATPRRTGQPAAQPDSPAPVTGADRTGQRVDTAGRPPRATRRGTERSVRGEVVRGILLTGPTTSPPTSIPPPVARSDVSTAPAAQSRAARHLSPKLLWWLLLPALLAAGALGERRAPRRR